MHFVLLLLIVLASIGCSAGNEEPAVGPGETDPSLELTPDQEAAERALK